MKIKRDSNIYKALKFANTKAYFDLRIGKQTTLCDIALGLLAAIGVTVGVLYVAILVILFLAVVLFTLLVSPFTDIWLPGADAVLVVTLLCCCVIEITAIFIILEEGLHHENVTPEYLKKWLNLKDEPSESFLSRWLKDRKEKICTIVTLEE